MRAIAGLLEMAARPPEAALKAAMRRSPARKLRAILTSRRIRGTIGMSQRKSSGRRVSRQVQERWWGWARLSCREGMGGGVVDPRDSPPDRLIAGVKRRGLSVGGLSVPAAQGSGLAFQP